MIRFDKSIIFICLFVSINFLNLRIHTFLYNYKYIDFWSQTIGHDPYASSTSNSADIAIKNELLKEQSDSLMLLAKMSKVSSSSSSEVRGGCKKCGSTGHLTFQCRNVIKESSTTASTTAYNSSNIDDALFSDSSSDSDSNSSNDEHITKIVGEKRERENDDTVSKKHKKKHKKHKKHKKESKHKKKSHKNEK